MVKKRSGFIKDYSLIYAIITIILLLNMNIIAVSSSSLPKNEFEENNLDNISISEEGNKVISQPLNLGVGIFWWMYDDLTLANTREDTRGFANYLASKGFRKDFDINEQAFTKFKLTDGKRGQDEQYFEQTDFVYFAGHGDHDCISTHPNFNLLTLAFYWECSWGDEGPVKWVGLASCFNTKNDFKYSMNGINMILGFSTWCDDKQFGETLAKHCTDDEMSIKESWFATTIEKSTTRNLEAKILGENSATGNDCIYNGGEFVGNVDVTNQITYWKCPVNHFPNIYTNTDEGQTKEVTGSQNSYSSQGTETFLINGGSSNVRGDPKLSKAFDSSSSDEAEKNSNNEFPEMKSQEAYYISTDDMSVVFPTILVSENDVYTADGPNLSYEKANWKSMAGKYMLDNDLLDKDDVEGIDYHMKMVPQKQGFSYKKTALGVLDQNEYFKEWDIALNVFIIKKINETEEKKSDPPTTTDEFNDNTADQKPDNDIADNNDFKADDRVESSEEIEDTFEVNKYQKTTLVISQGKKIGYSFTRVEVYNSDEHNTGGDDEP